MEEPKKDDVESPRVDKTKVKKILIKLGIIIVTVGILYGVGSLFISEPLPEEVDTREIYAFEYQYFIFDEITSDKFESDLDFYWFDSNGNPIEPEYWYSNCVGSGGNPCDETTPMTEKEIIVVKNSESIVKFIFAGDFIENNQGVIDSNQRVLDATFDERYQKYIYTLQVDDLKEFYDDSEILPMTTINIPLKSIIEPVVEQIVEEPKHDTDNHTHDKVTVIPMTILDMVYFLKDHPEINDNDSGILMSYAVAKETGMNPDEEVDHLAYHIMEKIQ